MKLKDVNKIKLVIYGLLFLVIVSLGILVYFNGSNPFLVYFKNSSIPGKIVSLDKEFTLNKSDVAHIRNKDLTFYYYFLKPKDCEDESCVELVQQFIYEGQGVESTENIPFNLEITHRSFEDYTASFVISEK